MVDRFLPPNLRDERVVARIGLISDTHMPDRCPQLPAALFEVLHGVDLLLHAGDVGELWVLDRLSIIAPVIAVHGNDDTVDTQRELPYQQILTVAGQRLVLTHAHYPDRTQELDSRKDDAWGPKLERRAGFGHSAGASIVVFGHTHIPMAHHYQNMLLINPGAIAAPNCVLHQRIQTVAVLFIRDDGLPIVRHIDLATPERVFVPQFDEHAGFAAAFSQYADSIMAADLEAIWYDLEQYARSLAPEVRAVLRAGTRHVQERRWLGDQTLITRAELLAEIQLADAIPADVRARITMLLSE